MSKQSLVEQAEARLVMGFSAPEVKEWLIRQGAREPDVERAVAAAVQKSRSDARRTALTMSLAGAVAVAFGAIWIVWIIVQGKIPIGSAVLAGVSISVGGFLVRTSLETLKTGRVSTKIDHRS